MNYLIKKIKANSLFTMMFTLSVCMIIAVSITITWATIRMAQQFFIEQYSINNSKIIGHIKNNFSSFHHSVVLAMNQVQQSRVIEEILSKEKTNNEKMNSIYTISQMMETIQVPLRDRNIGISIAGMNGFDFATNRAYWPITDQELRDSELLANTMKEPRRILYQVDRRQGREAEEIPYIVITTALMNRIENHVYGAMFVAVKESDFRKLYSDYTSNGNNILLVNQAGEVISSNVSSYIGTRREDVLPLLEEFEARDSDEIKNERIGENQVVLIESLPFFDMYLLNIIDKEMVLEGAINKGSISMIVMAIVAVALVIGFFATRKVTSSLSKLVKQISNTSQHNFEQHITVSGTDETREIGKAFNKMLDELHVYVDQLLLIQQQKREAELTALQRQINPHFLYNTLTSITFFVQQGEKEDAVETIHSLISLLQLSLGDMNEVISIEQEIAGLKNYAQINQKRYGDRIQVSFFVTPESANCQIPKLILQPFIENAFVHGFNQKAGGYIHIFVWSDVEKLVCEIIDNGDGIDPTAARSHTEESQKKKFFSGVGIKNVRERIQLIYGEGYGVKIDSAVNEGTRITITLPNEKMSTPFD